MAKRRRARNEDDPDEDDKADERDDGGDDDRPRRGRKREREPAKQPGWRACAGCLVALAFVALMVGGMAYVIYQQQSNAKQVVSEPGLAVDADELSKAYNDDLN